LLDAPRHLQLLLDTLSLAYLLHDHLPHLVVLHIYFVGGKSPSDLVE
jgi:hypothetical protein